MNHVLLSSQKRQDRIGQESQIGLDLQFRMYLFVYLWNEINKLIIKQIIPLLLSAILFDHQILWRRPFFLFNYPPGSIKRGPNTSRRKRVPNRIHNLQVGKFNVQTWVKKGRGSDIFVFFLFTCEHYCSWFNALNIAYVIFLVNIQHCRHQVAPPVKIMPLPFFHECDIVCGTTCNKLPMAKMITENVLIIFSHSY